MNNSQNTTLSATVLETPIGKFLAIGDTYALYALTPLQNTQSDCVTIKQFEKKFNSKIILQESSSPLPAPLLSIQKEMAHYCAGTIRTFETPINPVGTPFQKRVWEALRAIPFGETRSYKEIAVAIGNPKAYRAVAQANGANKLAIVIPCHRVINVDHTLGGYTGGIAIKKWLLAREDHERSNKASRLF